MQISVADVEAILACSLRSVSVTGKRLANVFHKLPWLQEPKAFIQNHALLRKNGSTIALKRTTNNCRP
jgi:hypothetical protein